MIELKTLKQLVKLMADNDLTELDIEGDQDKVRLRRRSETPDVQYVQQPASAPAAPPAAPAPAPTPQQPQPSADTGQQAAPAASADAAIKSPMVGTYYSAPSPDAKPFLQVGDKVEPDTVVCLIEAMKVFNEIKAETRGTVTRILVENGQAVEFGQPMFEIKPD